MGKTTVGDITVFILSDRYRDMDATLFLTPEPDQEALVKKIYPDGKTRNSLNTFLIKSGSGLVLVDTGYGVRLGPEPGKLPEALVSAGFSPVDISDVIITHTHLDHIGGLELNGKASFPNATVHLSKVEHDFWTTPENEAKVPERLRGTFASAREILALYPGKVMTFDPGKELFPGVTPLAAYGHTPGHVAVLVNSRGETLLIWGDLLHGMHLQLARPDIAIVFDFDHVAAIASRKAMLTRAASEKWRVTGVHVPDPEAYSLQKVGDGFALIR